MKLIFLAVALALIAFSANADDMGDKINKLIEQSNYCSADSDCVEVNFGCPFGCGSFINIQDEEKLKMLTQTYMETHEQCEYKCEALREHNLICKDKTCQPAFK